MTQTQIKEIARWWRFCRLWYRIGAIERDLHSIVIDVPAGAVGGLTPKRESGCCLPEVI